MNYLKGAFKGSTTVPCLTMTLGKVAFWKVALDAHSSPIGILNALSYCSLVSYG